MIVIPDVGKTANQKIWTGEKALPTLTIRLFQNNYTPVAASVLGSFTVATFTGYAGIDLANPVTQAALDASNRAVTFWDLVEWTKNGATGNTIYGYFVVDDDNNLLYAERFESGAWPMLDDLARLTFIPQLTYRSQFGNG